MTDSTRFAWVGLNDQNTEGTFVWNDGTCYDYNITWSTGEPNDNNGEDCTWYQDGNLANDVGCETSLKQFFCNLGMLSC